jgi:hypothetical protein
MRNLNLLLAASSLAIMPQAFASGKGAKGAEAPADAPQPEPAATTASTQDRATPIITAPTFLALPVKPKTNRGSKSVYNFESLEAPKTDDAGNTLYANFAVMNKTAKQLRSVVSAANKKQLQPASNPDGSPKFKMQTLKDAAGNPIAVPTQEREQEHAKYFRVYDVDPSTDPDGASARVFRTDNPNG